jgi:hypothetical protein
VLSLGLSLASRARGGAGGAAASAAALALEFTRAGPTVEAVFTAQQYAQWTNDPAYADRVGDWKAAGGEVPFAQAVTFTRASTALGTDIYGSLSQVAVDGARMGYDAAGAPAGLLVEGATTNQVRNPRAEGAVAGTPGTMPTFWSGSTAAGGLSRSSVVVQAVDGMTALDIRVSGTTSGPNTFFNVSGFETATAPAAAGQTWTGSCHLALLAGSLAGLTLRIELPKYTAASAYINSAASGGLSPGATAQRFSFTNTPADGTLGFLGLGLQLFVAAASAVVDFTVRVYGPQLEQQPFATSLILPPAAAPAASTRAADVATVSGQAFADAFGAGAAQGWVVVEASLPQAAPAGVNAFLAQIDDGTNDNRVYLINVAGTATVSANARVATVYSGNAAPANSFTAGSPFRAAMRWGSGTLACCLGAGAVATLTGAVPSGLTTLRLGNVLGSSNPLNGRIRGLWCGPEQPSNAQLQAATTLGADVAAAIRG